MDKAPDAFRTISEVSSWLDTPTHVLRFWESRFPEVAPVKRAGGRRYYRVEDMRLLGGIKKLLHEDGVTIKALQERIKAEGAESVAALSPALDTQPSGEPASAEDSAAPVTPSEVRPATKEAGPTTAPALPRRGNRQRSLSLGDAPTPRAPSETAAPTREPGAGASFRRHPARVSRETAPKPDPKKTTRAHPSRPGLFVYDDSDLREAAPADSTAPDAQPALAPIDHLPADAGDDTPARDPLPAAADLRALALLARAPGPTVAEAVDRLHALRNRWT